MGKDGIKHWTAAPAESDYKTKSPILITVNDRAATRQAIINQIRYSGLNFVERSDWGAHKNRSVGMVNDWDYSRIALHHAGRSFACGPGALQLQEIQEMQMNKAKGSMDDIGYHYAVDCIGTIYEGRDIRFKGENVHNFNTGVIGVVLLENLTEPNEGNDGVSKLRRILDSVGYNQYPKIPDRQKQAVRELVKSLRDFFYITTLGGHREFPGQLGEGKICPGNVGLAFVKELRMTMGFKTP